MNRYLVYITEGGLMEDPMFHDEHHRVIYADNEEEAIKKWAKETNHDDSYLDVHGRSYWGWKITVT